MNKKGMTVIEVLISIVLTTIVVAFIINLLMTIKNYTLNNQTKSDLLINQAVIVKAIEKDFMEYGLKEVTRCEDINTLQDKKIIPASDKLVSSNPYCLKLVYKEDILGDNNIGYLLQYTYKYSTSETKNVVGYKRGLYQTIRETPIKMAPDSNKKLLINQTGIVSNACNNNVCSLMIKMPVIDSKDNSYDIIATYIYEKGKVSVKTNSF